MTDFLKHYIIAALWSSTGDDGEPLDETFDIKDVSQEAIEKMQADCDSFQGKADHILEDEDIDLSDEQIAHDFWLTRCGHGTGFWDRGLGEVGDKLTELAKTFGECWLYVGDDGKIYVM